MKRLIVLLCVVISAIAVGCSKERDSLIGDINCFYDGTEMVIMDHFFDESCRYSFVDINDDRIQDLVIEKESVLYIIDLNLKRAVYKGYTYEHVFKKNDTVGIFYRRPGGAPDHEDFQVIVFDKDWNDLVEISWSKYDWDNDGDYDEDDVYLVNGEECNLQKWEELIERYEEYEEYCLW